MKKKKKLTEKQVLRETFKNFVLELKIKGFSEQTIDIYLYYNGKFLDFIKKEQKCITSGDIREYLNYLIDKKVAPRTINMAINSLKAYYEGFLRKKLFKFIKRSKIPKDIPNVLTRDEIKNMINNTTSLKYRLLIELLYSSGMRVGECVKIKVNDINVNEKIIFIKKGKGNKDRFTITSKTFIDNLNKYLTQKKKQAEYLFDNGYGKHISIRTAEKIVNMTAKKTGIQKRVYPHLLRASFATHLIEDNVDILSVKKLLGHERITTTQMYIRTSTNDIKTIKSPLDRVN
jgi:site-specific recombinase XerD